MQYPLRTYLLYFIFIFMMIHFVVSCLNYNKYGIRCDQKYLVSGFAHHHWFIQNARRSSSVLEDRYITIPYLTLNGLSYQVECNGIQKFHFIFTTFTWSSSIHGNETPHKSHLIILRAFWPVNRWNQNYTLLKLNVTLERPQKYENRKTVCNSK